MKLTPVVNFTNILQAALTSIFFGQKLQTQTVIKEKLQKNTALVYFSGPLKNTLNLWQY